MSEYFLLRPDSLYILENELIYENLSRYLSIIKKTTLPKFYLAKCFEFEIKDEDDLNQAINEFNKFVLEYDSNKFEVKLKKHNLLTELINFSKKLLENCILCEHKCRINRKSGELGKCRVDITPRVSSVFVHLGEEPWIVPSLTVFFAGCNFKCVYCQNYDISQNPRDGEIIDSNELAMIINRYTPEVRNVNFVGGDPTPNLYYILKVLDKINNPIPIVWNSNAYESEITSKILACIVDIYLYDFKYGNNECAKKLSKVDRYFEVVTRNILFANKFGELSLRHLVLPNHIECCSKKILLWISDNLKHKYVLQLLNQYRPKYLAKYFPDINRKLSSEEYDYVIKLAKKRGINFFIQEI